MPSVSHTLIRGAWIHPTGIASGEAGSDPIKDRQFVTALARGLDILRAFQAGEGMLGNQEIAQRTGLPKPTVARLTHTLTELGYLTYIRRFRKYELGASVLALGYAALSNLDVRKVARPLMTQLANTVGGSVALGGRDRHSMIYLEAVRGPSVVALTHETGSRVPIAATSMGWAYLHALQESERLALIDSIRRRRSNDWNKFKTLYERAERDLNDKGYCLSWGDWMPEICGVGVPLRSPDGSAIYALNCSGPLFQVSRERLEHEWGPRLVKLARDVRNGLAARPSHGNGNGHGGNGLIQARPARL